MYPFFTVIIIIFIALLITGHLFKRKNIQKVLNMSKESKYALINKLIEPFGYYYIAPQDLFTTRIDAWQREFGYCTFYDKIAPHFHMIYDCLPVYFNYRGRTWLLELWKGQYGINTGCEIGLYYANQIIDRQDRDNTLFQSIDNQDMVKMSFTLYQNGTNIAHLSHRHWWLTSFCVGSFSNPSKLSLRATLTFPTTEMARSFVNALKDTGFSSREISIHCSTVSLTFSSSPSEFGRLQRIRICFAQFSNYFWCKVYQLFTSPFTLSVDKLLYLYFFLPPVFRRTLHIHKSKRYKNNPLFHSERRPV